MLEVIEQDEEWRKIPGVNPDYEVSNLGRVRGPKGILKPVLKPAGYHCFTPGKGNLVYIHRAVAEAFIPNPENLPVVRHLNDSKDDNRVENLRWGTQADNMMDCSRNGRNHETLKTHCPKGRPYSGENLVLRYRVTKNGTKSALRICRECKNNYQREYNKRKPPLPPNDPRHGTVNGFGNWKCRCEPCRQAKKESRSKEKK